VEGVREKKTKGILHPCERKLREIAEQQSDPGSVERARPPATGAVSFRYNPPRGRGWWANKRKKRKTGEEFQEEDCRAYRRGRKRFLGTVTPARERQEKPSKTYRHGGGKRIPYLGARQVKSG